MLGGQPGAFAQMLKYHRIAAGLSQAALAERAHLSRDGVSALERGVSRTPRQDTVQLLVDALKLSVAEQDQLLAAVQPRRAMASAPHHTPRNARIVSVPTPLTSLVGREHEIEAVSQLLCREDVRLVTLTGAPGIGKTRLAIHVAKNIATAFSDGVVFVPLAPIREPSLLMPTIARAVRLRDGGEPAVGERLQPELGACVLLLTLDNFEHLLSAAPALADLLGASPTVKALVTSRAALRVRGEHEFPVAPLALPGEVAADAPLDVWRTPAVDLFVRRASAVQPGFALTAQVAPVIAQISRQVDGLPLALELAAARIKLLPPVALLERLAPALPLLTGGGQDLPERQHTMRRAIAWSYDLLEPRMQRFFRSFAIFAGGWTLAAAERVCGVTGTERMNVLDALAALMDHSLVMRIAVDSHESRFRLLATLREFGLERLAESGEMDTLARRHAHYYMEVAEAWDADVDSGRGTISFVSLEDERNNLNAALRWAIQRSELEIGGRIAGALARFWRQSGYVTEGRAWLREMLAAYKGADGHDGHARSPELAAAHVKVVRGAALLAAMPNTAETVLPLAGENVEFAYLAGDGWNLA